MITENLSTLKINKLTQEQYDKELLAGNIDENELYLTPYEEVDLSPYAVIDVYDNETIEDTNVNLTSSDLEAISKYIKASLDVLVITGVDADGVTHTWSVYGVK